MEKIWWNQVTNAVKYVFDVTRNILGGKSVLLMCASGSPWREQFETSVIENVKLQDAEKKFENISFENKPGDYLLQEFCKKEKRSEFRPSVGYAKFLAQNDDTVIHDRYFWVQVDDDSLEKWMDFVSDYLKERGKKDKSAVFILEYRGNNTPPPKKGIKSLSLDSYISDYDRIVFTVLAASEVKESVFVKDYVAELVADVAENDIELAARCIREYKTFSAEPWAYIEKVLSNEVRSDGTEYSFYKKQSEVEHCIWKAQIKSIYPYLEEFREEFIQKHESSIMKALPIEASNGERYEDPKDVELGSLMYMAGEGKLRLDSIEYEKLKRFKEARNRLSHLRTLSFEEIKNLTT